MWFSAVVLCSALAPGCAPADPEDVGTDSARVVGGRAESGYPATGYLTRFEAGAHFALGCGVTLIAPDLAVTAGHCVIDDKHDTTRVSVSRSFGMGFGSPLAPSREVRVSHVLVQPAFVSELAATWRGGVEQQDLAVLRLERPITDVAPARIGRVDEPRCGFRYVGYGRTTPGDFRVREGYTRERKSAGQCVALVRPQTVVASGTDGGLCWGDSGGPLYVDGTNEVLGVLADFDGVFACRERNWVQFTSLEGHRDFLQCARARLGVPGARRAPFPDVLCHWAEDLIAPLARAGVLRGYPDSTFQPAVSISRAEFAAMIAAALAPAPLRASRAFSDVPSSAWYARAVDTVQRAGFMSGYPDGTFRPLEPITRLETVIALAAGLRLPDSDDAVLAVLEDERDIPDWARRRFAAAIHARLVFAYPDVSRFDPQLPARRGDVAAMIHQAMVRLGRLPALENEYVVSPE